MAKKIEKRVRDEKFMFKHVVMAVVSQQPNPQKIQRQIAEALGLQLNQESLEYRARKLHERLKAEKGILIILDDVWERLNLEKLGIPSQSTHAECKLILTSQDKHIFNLPGNPVLRIFQLPVLTDEESWNFFREKAGIPDDSHDLNGIARNVAKERKGLPLALKTVGCALRGRNESFWEDALVQLQQSMPRHIPYVLEDVYKPLLLSINRLESEEARYLFLLCCLFPEDYEISHEELVRCGMGLRIFEGVENLTSAGNRVESILEILIYRSLLIKSSDDWGNLHVKMHNVIRDVGIWIASEKKIESDGNIASKEKHVCMISHGTEEWPMKEEDSYVIYTCISLQFSRNDIVIPDFIHCPRLQYLRMGLSKSWPGYDLERLEKLTGMSNLKAGSWPSYYLEIRDKFFSEMSSLKVLEASHIASLPSSVGLLKNLRTLHLFEN